VLESLQLIVQNTLNAWGLTDIAIGTVIGVVVGGLVMSAINNGMILMNLGTHFQYVVKAIVLIGAVFIDVYTRRKSGLG